MEHTVQEQGWQSLLTHLEEIIAAQNKHTSDLCFPYDLLPCTMVNRWAQ